MWNQAPLVRLLLPFIAGIIAAISLPVPLAWLSPLVALCTFIIAAIVLIPKLNVSYRRNWWFGMLLNLMLIAMGYQLTIVKTERFALTHFSKFIHPNVTVLAKLEQPYIEKERSYKAVLDILSVKQEGSWIPVSGKAMAYIRKDEHAQQLRYGDELIFNADFRDIQAVQNPGEFDYKRFLSFHNIFQQVMISKDQWMNVHVNTGNPILKASYALRDQLLEVLTSEQLKDDEFAVGAALLLGYCDKLDAEILAAYAGTGALHVLSVSGLHVAIVYIVFNWLLFFFDKIKYGNVFKAAALIVLLWFYSALTGLSPSVLRAATMFSLIIIAKAFNRHTNIYNTLAASAFLLLLINPYLVMDVGFQLSYIAVAGIVLLQPMISGIFEPQSWITEQVWSVTSVSIAAQLTTFPLGLYYFHQFPNYFLVANFVVIPVSTVIIYVGIALFLFSKISFIAHWLGIGFSWSVWLLNASVKWIEKWPYALLDGISISFTELLIVYAMVFSMIFYFSEKRLKYLLCSCSMAIVLLISQLIEQRQQAVQRKLIVYSIGKTMAIDFISGRNNVLLTDSAVVQNPVTIRSHLKNNWSNLGMKQTEIVCDSALNGDLYLKNGIAFLMISVC